MTILGGYTAGRLARQSTWVKSSRLRCRLLKSPSSIKRFLFLNTVAFSVLSSGQRFSRRWKLVIDVIKQVLHSASQQTVTSTTNTAMMLTWMTGQASIRVSDCFNSAITNLREWTKERKKQRVAFITLLMKGEFGSCFLGFFLQSFDWLRHQLLLLDSAISIC